MDYRLDRVIKYFREEGMVVGADGATAAADDAGPLAGFDPKLKGKMLRRKVIGRWSRSLRKKKKEIKESYNSSDWRDGYRPTEFESVDVIKPEPLQPTKSILNIEVPQTQTDFNMGLMFRDELEENSGMLFAFKEEGQKYFHMKDTTIPLDIAFINKYGIIESIKELEPLNVIPVYSDADVLYALEVNRGWFVEHNVKVGDKILESSVTIENSDGKKFADIYDIVGPSHMQPVIQDGVWKGHRLTEEITYSNFRKRVKDV